MELDKKLYAPLNDRRGNVVALLDPDTAQVVERYEYDAFGNETIFSQSHATGNSWRLVSKRVDPETGLVYFGRRYYDPSLGKWLTHDPLGLKEGPNLYAYVLNNPLTKFDLYGLYDADDCGGGTDVGSDNRDFRHEHSDQRDHPFSNSYTHERSDSESGVRYETASNPFSSADFWNDKEFYCREDDDDDRKSGWDSAIDYGLAALDGICLASDVYAVYALLFCNPAGILSAVGAKTASMIGRTITKLARSNISGRIKNPIAHQVKNTLHITPKEFFGNQTYAEAEKVLTNKFGSPKGGGEFNKSFYNSKTGRTFNLHHDPSHRSRRPHIDIRKRGLKTDHYKDKPFYLKE